MNSLIQKKDGEITFTWLAGVLLTIVGSLLAMVIGAAMTSQAAQDTKIDQNTNDISTVKTESTKQTALLIVVAEKVGVPPSEVNQLLGQ